MNAVGLEAGGAAGAGVVAGVVADVVVGVVADKSASGLTVMSNAYGHSRASD